MFLCVLKRIMELIGMTKNKFDNRADKLGESWDLLNKKGQKIGLKHRGEPFRPGEWHLLVNATIFNYQHEILMQQRSFNKIGRPGEWDLETGGSVLSGEDSLTAIKREVKEEVGLELNFSEENFVETFRHWPVFDNWYVVKYDLSISDIKIQKSELEQAKFMPFSEAVKYLSSDYLPYLLKADKKLFGGENA